MKLALRFPVPFNMIENLTWFIAVTAAAVVLQMLILLAMYIAVRKLSVRMEGLANKVEEATTTVVPKVLPLLENLNSMQQEVKGFLEVAKPKVDVVLDNLSHVTTTARGSVERIDATVNDIVDRVRLQVIRGDEMVTRTMDRVEETSEKVQHTVMSPVRQVSGVLQAISVGVGTFFNSQRRRRNGGPSDEMFI
jgi:methyl-accepting chemotaxis protein